jgi:hypothetical protein
VMDGSTGEGQAGGWRIAVKASVRSESYPAPAPHPKLPLPPPLQARTAAVSAKDEPLSAWLPLS